MRNALNNPVIINAQPSATEVADRSAPSTQLAPDQSALVVPPRSIPDAPLKQPPYPRQSRKSHEQGIVALSVLVLEDGRISDVLVEVSTGYPALDKAAVDTVRSEWRLAPGTIRGKPAAMWGYFEITFSLQISKQLRDQTRELKAAKDKYNSYVTTLEAKAKDARVGG